MMKTRVAATLATPCLLLLHAAACAQASDVVHYHHQSHESHAAAAPQQVAAQVVPRTEATASTEVIRARELLRAGDVAEATTVLESVRAQAAGSGAKTDEANALFYLGVAQQARIQSQQLPEADRLRARAEAISAYEQSLQVNPASGPALNNLAQLYRAEPARRDEADALLARAIELGDSRKGVYLLNRAALKRDAGDIPAALDLAEQAAAADRASLEAHRMVVDVALESESATPLLAYLKELNAAGLVARALESAASALQGFPGDRARLLVSIGESLGNAAYMAWPQRFAETDAGKSLYRFREDPEIGSGVRELFAVLEQPVPAQSFGWWRRGYTQSAMIAPASPAAVMQNLTRRCGEIYRSAGDPANLSLAERYYRLAIDLSGPGTDPRAFVALAEILFDSNRVDDLGQILSRYEAQLLRTKGDAIARSDSRQVFELRLALGMMYAYTKRWVNAQTPYAGAIWMLDHAQQSANEYNEGRPGREQIGLPPDAVKMLSMGHVQTGNVNKSITTRLDAAERYLTAGQAERAADVLDQSWRSSLPADLDPPLARRLEQTVARIDNAQ